MPLKPDFPPGKAAKRGLLLNRVRRITGQAALSLVVGSNRPPGPSGEPGMQTSFSALRILGGRPATPSKPPLTAEEAQRRLWQVEAAIRICQGIETACHILLAVSGIGTVLYGVAMLLRSA